MCLPTISALRVFCIVTTILVSSTFGLFDGAPAFAHGEPEPEPPKAAATPAPPPLPPRPTEYPRGLNEKPKPGEATHLQAMPKAPASAKPEQSDGKGEATIPRAATDGNADAPKAVHWSPPKRYHFVMDAFTGLAIGGNDPVGFFVEGEARLGSADHELDWGGTTWHFLNEGNLIAFKQNPEIYAPRFGGRCAFALSQGLLVEGTPSFFVVYRDRLYLFANAGYRAAFLINPDAYIAEADREWPILTRGEP